MAIKGLTDRGMAFPEIGAIRKGAKKTDQKRPGLDLKYFRIDIDADEEKRYQTATKLAALYGSEPTAITIILPFDSIEQVWDAWREKYAAGAMLHRCDGENVRYEINGQTGERIVVNGLRVDNGQPQPCKISQLAKPQCCVPVGRLKVIIPALNRLAYFVVHTTSIHDIINISEQLEAIKNLNGGHIAGVPLVLKRVPREISTPSGQNGQRARREKWLISIEADPTWVERKVAALGSAAMPQLQATAPLALSAGPDLAKLAEYDDDETDDAPITGEVLETSALVDSRTGYVVGESNGKTAKIYDDAKLVTNEQYAQARAEFPEAESKFDTPQPTAQAKPEDGGRKLFEDYCETRNLPEFKRFALLNSAGGDYVTALEFAKKVK